MKHTKKTLGLLTAAPLALLVGCGDSGPEMGEPFEPSDQPEMEQQEGMGAPPPPPANDGAGAPPPEGGMGTPPPEGGMDAPPEGDNGDDQDQDR
jgi:hypothetical protein